MGWPRSASSRSLSWGQGLSGSPAHSEFPQWRLEERSGAKTTRGTNQSALGSDGIKVSDKFY